jgi:hypothetical protein
MIAETTMPHNLNSVRSQLEWVCECLIPKDSEGTMPSALEVGVIDRLLPRALKSRPDLEADFIDALKRLPEVAPADPLAAVQSLGDAHFEHVSHLIAGAYFLDDEVNRRLKYPGQQALHDTPDYDEVMEVAENIMGRGVIFITTPDRA